MKLSTFQIRPDGNIPLKTNATTLDEMTNELPQGFYTTFSTLTQGTRVLGLHSHLQRLYIPAQESKLKPAVDEVTLRKRIASLVTENLPEESRVRLILTKDTGSIYLGIQPFTPLSEMIRNNGVRVITAATSRNDPRIKGTDFISKSAEQRKLIGKDIFEILLTHNGKILEGMTSNFYAVKENKLITAQNGILLGVTRRAILRIAREQGMLIEYRAPNSNEVFGEAFLTSSSRGVVPIISIDNQSVGQGSVGKWTKLLAAGYQAYVLKKAELIFTVNRRL